MAYVKGSQPTYIEPTPIPEVKLDPVAVFKQYETPAVVPEVWDPLVTVTDGVSEVQQGILQSSNFRSGMRGWRLNSNGRGEFKDVTIGGRILTLSEGQSLSEAITLLNAGGGGTINLKAGTYVVTSAITLKSSINIIGEDVSNTIISFAGTSANISCTGTSVYTTGTITVASGANITGSGTSWLANVTAGQHLFLGTRWYKIAAVTSDTTLVLSEGYGDNVTLPSTYRIATITRGFSIKDVLLTGSTGTALSLQDVRQSDIDNVILYSNNKGLVLTNASEISATQVLAVSNTSNGVELTNCGLFDWGSINLISNGGSGLVASNIKDILIFPSVASANTTDGYNLTTAVNLTLLVDSSGNGSNGIELVATNDDINLINPRIVGNTSDGIKLTATSDNVKITAGRIQANGGYGVNIAASTCDNTNIVGNVFSSNSSGACSDSGTDTVIRGNNGLSDNSASSGIADGGFKGTGADGALAISSGTTTIDCANAALVVKNYSSISITGTGKLAFSNPNTSGTFIILKSQGAVTLTSSTSPCLDASGMGAAGGGGGAGATAGTATTGSAGTTARLILDDSSHHGTGGEGGDSGGGAPGGSGGAIYTNLYLYTTEDARLQRNFLGLACGSGGGGGGGSLSNPAATGGDGGRGGGALQINCGGALNFTGTISVAGLAGSDGGDVGSSGFNLAAAGGGGGGAGGYCAILYTTLVSAAGTILSGGGAGGAGGDSTDAAGGSGGNTNLSGAGGGGAGASGGAGGAGATGNVGTTNNGNNGSAAAGARAGGGGGSGSAAAYNSSTTTTGGTGGAAGASASGVVMKNTIFA